MKITKVDAAGMHLDAAVDHFLRQQWVPAIHCAGAAEELCGRMLQGLGGKTIPDDMWESNDFTDLVDDKKEFISELNTYRDWIKHTNKDHADTIEIDEPHALFSVQRAMRAYGRLLEKNVAPQRASIEQFGKWFFANGTRLEEMMKSLPDGAA